MNWIVVAGLGGLGFAFPPVWIALGLYLLWALFLKRGMRGGIIKKDGSIRISYAHGLTGRIPTAAARTARGVGCLGSTAR